jgi:hypothetical protein
MWSQGFGDARNQEGTSVAVDGAGNVLSTGYFEGAVDFGGGPLMSAGDGDIYLAKFDTDGNHIWSQRFGDSARQWGISTAADGPGNILLTGFIVGITDFGGGPLIGDDRGDIFLAKFDPSGNHIWSQGFAGSYQDVGWCVAVDDAGNTLLTGYYEGTVDFGGGPLPSTGGWGIYVAKFDPSGNHIWSQGFGDTGINWGTGVAADGAGNVLLTGRFEGVVDFGGGPLPSAGEGDIFLAKFDLDGNHIWSQRFGNSELQWGRDIAVDGAGDVFITGQFRGTVDFGGGPLMSAGRDDIYLAKFDSGGNHIWSQRFGGSDDQEGWSVAVDGLGNALLTGSFEAIVDFGGGPLSSAGDWDIFLAKFDRDGNHIWSQGFGGSDSQNAFTAAVDGAGNVLLTGSFLGTVDFGGEPLTSAGGRDIFLAKFGSDEPTPVLLSQVSAREVGFAVELSWIALPDLSIDRFEIYRAIIPNVEESRKLATVEPRGREQTYRDETVVPGETYYYWIGVVDIFGGRDDYFGPFSITFVGSEDPLLFGSYPNPAVVQATIRFYVPKPSDAILSIYGANGRIVRLLRATGLGAGTHSFVWDRRDQEGRLVAKGSYFYSIRVSGAVLVGGRLVVLGEPSH